MRLDEQWRGLKLMKRDEGCPAPNWWNMMKSAGPKLMKLDETLPSLKLILPCPKWNLMKIAWPKVDQSWWKLPGQNSWNLMKRRSAENWNLMKIARPKMKLDKQIARPKIETTWWTLPGPKWIFMKIARLKLMKLDENCLAQNETWWKLPGLKLMKLDKNCPAQNEAWWKLPGLNKVDERWWKLPGQKETWWK